MHAAGAEELGYALEHALGEDLRAHRPPGAILGVRDRAGLRRAAIGTADVPSGRPASTECFQDIASVSKVLTALATLVLVSRGELKLNDTVGHLVGAARATVHTDVSVEDLLRHRAGMKPWMPLYLMPGSADPVDRALSLRPAGPPGAQRVYSDLGMMVLGHLLETVTGKELSAVIDEVVLRPLGTTAVVPGAPPDDAPTLTGGDGDAIEKQMVRTGIPYRTGLDTADFDWRTDPVRREIGDGNAHHAFGGIAGHAGWFSTIDGLLAVAAALADPVALGIDEATRCALLHEVDHGQGLGARLYRVSWNGRTRTFLGHPGFTGAFIAASTDDGDDPVLTALLVNRLHGSPAPESGQLRNVEQLWHQVMACLDAAENSLEEENPNER